MTRTLDHRHRPVIADHPNISVHLPHSGATTTAAHTHQPAIAGRLTNLQASRAATTAASTQQQAVGGRRAAQHRPTNSEEGAR